jgi:hypothetical protein
MTYLKSSIFIVLETFFFELGFSSMDGVGNEEAESF